MSNDADFGIYPVNTLKPYRFVVILSKYQGKILLSRHRDRRTWEAQGGHIEAEETPLAAARRELYEESGDVDFKLAPLCDYRFEPAQESPGAGCRVFSAEIFRLGPLPESEIAEIREFDRLPANLTYASVTPALFKRRL